MSARGHRLGVSPRCGPLPHLALAACEVSGLEVVAPRPWRSDAGFGRRLPRLVADRKLDLASGQARQAIYNWARAATLSTTDVERGHAQNMRTHAPGMSMQQFVATLVNIGGKFVLQIAR